MRQSIAGLVRIASGFTLVIKCVQIVRTSFNSPGCIPSRTVRMAVRSPRYAGPCRVPHVKKLTTATCPLVTVFCWYSDALVGGDQDLETGFFSPVQ